MRITFEDTCFDVAIKRFITSVGELKSKLFVLAVTDKPAPPYDRLRGGVDQYLNSRIEHCFFVKLHQTLSRNGIQER